MPKRKDLTNQTFGRLKVLSYQFNGKYLCQCECKNQTEVFAQNLRNHCSQSCGCLRTELLAKRNIPKTNLINQQFGRLTVLSYHSKGKWKCLCKCNKIINVSSTNLKHNKTTSCGCFQKESSSYKHTINLINQQFGKLKVLKRNGSKQGNALWLCQCQCKTKITRSTTQLRNQNVTACRKCKLKENKDRKIKNLNPLLI